MKIGPVMVFSLLAYALFAAQPTRIWHTGKVLDSEMAKSYIVTTSTTSSAADRRRNIRLFGRRTHGAKVKTSEFDNQRIRQVCRRLSKRST